jgi:hypothetical protein
MSTLAANTANCYIVDAPGYYMLPLVYGNAIKAGAPNPSSYSTDVDPADPNAAAVLKTFLRHDDQPITAPYIYNNAGITTATVKDATLVWMDAPELITDVKLSSDNHFLQFRLTPEAIAQGNAVLAIRNTTGEILWSWHIWVTPLVSPTAPETDLMINRTDDHYNFMQYNLGWATATTMNYGAGTGSTQPRQVQVKITQTGVANPASETFVVTQASETAITKGNAPFWQWGRKDPMPPGKGSGDGASGERQLWFGDNTYKYTTLPGLVSLGAAIKNPFRMIRVYSGQDWCSTSYTNLWDGPNAEMGEATFADATIVKTVYDPNPVGFKMPPSNVWTRFNLTLGNYGGASNINSSSGKNYIFDGGYMFHTQADKSGPTVFYPNTGYRYLSNSLSGVDKYSIWHSALPYNNVSGVGMICSSEDVRTQITSSRGSGNSIRSITD